jgi:hypothetical protein
MTIRKQGRSRAFTLVELSLAIGIGMAISALSLALFQQQLSFLNIFRSQSFLTDEVPVINMHVSKLVGKAERFRLHATVEDALNGVAPRLTASPVLILNFRQPDGSMRASILSFENRGNGKALYHYVVADDGTLNAPQWHVTKAPSDVSFAVEQGILRMTLTGPNNERVTYSGAMTQ